MTLNELTAISPVDGRYRSKICELSEYFSEYALIRYRLKVEVEYFIKLCKIPLPQLKDVNHKSFSKLQQLYRQFDCTEALEVKKIEKVLNHDVKAVEVYIRNKFDELGLGKYKEFIHFGLTSQDINNTAIPYSLKDSMIEVYFPALNDLISTLSLLSNKWANVPMLAHTHGQPASPTRVGKEVKVFIERLEKQLSLLQLIPFSAKFGGATGNFNAHFVAYPEIDWVDFGNAFVNNDLDLCRSQTTTQIEHYDNIAAIFDNLKRINTIMIDLCRDMWTYISMNYFKQKINENEVGSSAMPHKVNPIDFENSEGNLGVANAIFEHLSAKLPVSRLQRDLTDSTVLRNIGVPLAHTLLAIKSLVKGLNKLVINEEKLQSDLEDNWTVVAEALQTILRREGYANPYELLKKLTRTNKKLDKETLHYFIDTLEIERHIKDELKKITPNNYTGIL
ncbi:MAG: adenylosuccinate lyase [Bacteroidetes bacterium GWA2_31_9]|nr:MAG: adenylosuccinate lyase [Bacteroidetes bacterium GWA2_31_9]